MRVFFYSVNVVMLVTSLGIAVMVVQGFPIILAAWIWLAISACGAGLALGLIRLSRAPGDNALDKQLVKTNA